MLMPSFRMKCLISRLRPMGINGRMTRFCSSQQTASVAVDKVAPDRPAVVDIAANWPGPYRVNINNIIQDLSTEECYAAEAKLRHIDRSNWIGYLSTFRRRLVKSPIEALGSLATLKSLVAKLDAMSAEEPIMIGDFNIASNADSCRQFLYDIAMRSAEVELKDLICDHKIMFDTSDMRVPHEWYPYARLMKRKVIFHGGPTNSGKTYQALQRLKNADPEKGGGVYCGPLRLLALEVFDSLNRQGVYTNLMTGQERQDVDFASHTSCTVEMVKLDKDYDVAVIDEIQMIANDQRGYAWTRVLLGLRAREIHVCGGMEACEIVRTLMVATGDDFEVVDYRRLSPLVVSDISLRGDYGKVQPGDCIVAFSKAEIFSIRRQIERLTPYKCAMIYGQLPPETRSTQARLFNEENTGYDILVASDAIGMGLNLNIKRIIFHTATKNEGLNFNWCDPSSVKQIAGRAGRLSSNYKHGVVTAWQEADLAYIRGVMSWDIPPITAAGIFPSVELIDLFSQQLKKSETAVAAQMESDANAEKVEMDDEMSPSELIAHDLESAIPPNSEDEEAEESRSLQEIKQAPKAKALNSKFVNTVSQSDSTRLAVLIERFVESSKLDGKYFLCDHAHIVLVSNWLHSIPLTLAERFIFANAPADIRSPISMTMLYQFAAAYAMRKPVALNVRLSRKKPRDVLELSDLCIKHNTLDLYLWLSIRFPAFFVEQDVCQEQKAFAIECIQGSLESPHLQHKFSHSNTYQTSRKKMLTSQNLGLPSLSYGEVRDSYLKNIELIDDANLYMFPTEAEESQVMGYGPATTRGFTKDPTIPSKHRDNKESRSAALPIGLRGGPPAEAYVERSHVNGRRFSSKGSQNRQNNPLTGKMNTENTARQEKAVAAIPFKSSANIVVDKNGKKVYRLAGQPQPLPQKSNNPNVRNKNNHSPGKSSMPSQPENSHLKTKLASEVSSS